MLKNRTLLRCRSDGLMDVAADDAANLRMGVDDAPKFRGVAQRDAVEPCAAHRQRMVVHADEHVLVGVRR